MKTKSRLALLGAMLIASACDKGGVAPRDAGFESTLASLAAGAVCNECRWENVLDRDIPVSLLTCMDANDQPQHCHLEVKDGMPERSVRITNHGDLYDFVLTSKDDPDSGMECPDLALHSNVQIIWGKCQVREPDLEGGAEHHFAAKLENLSQQETKLRIRFIFRHEPLDTGRDPIHNGEGHADP